MKFHRQALNVCFLYRIGWSAQGNLFGLLSHRSLLKRTCPFLFDFPKYLQIPPQFWTFSIVHCPPQSELSKTPLSLPQDVLLHAVALRLVWRGDSVEPKTLHLICSKVGQSLTFLLDPSIGISSSRRQFKGF
jgi:hypothetical protein